MASPASDTKDHWEIMRIAANHVRDAAAFYLTLDAPSKISFFRRSRNCPDEAKKLQDAALAFLQATQTQHPEQHQAYFTFVKTFIETYNTIPSKDALRDYLQKDALMHFQKSLNTLLQLRSEHTSQEFLGPYILLVREKFNIKSKEEENRFE